MTGSASGATWSTDVAWQEGSKVSQLKQSGNPVNVLAVVVNENSHASTSSQSTSFSQTFKNHGGAYEVYLTPSVGFKMKNLGGGASNFHYQFSKTVDAGKTWTKISTHRFSHVNGVSFVDKDTGYLLNNSPATSVSPDLFVTHDGGVKWTKQKLPIPSSYKNDYRHSSYPIFFSKQIGFIPIYGQSMNSSGKTQFLYMLVSKDGGASWKAYTTHQGSGLTWTLKRQKLAVSYGKQTITVSGLFGVWSVSP